MRRWLLIFVTRYKSSRSTGDGGLARVRGVPLAGEALGFGVLLRGQTLGNDVTCRGIPFL